MIKSGIFLMAVGFGVTMVGTFTEVIPSMIIGGVFFGLGAIVLIAKIFTDQTKDQKKGKGYVIWGIIDVGLLTAGVVFIPDGVISLLFLIPGGILLMILFKYRNALIKKKGKNDDDEAEKW